MRVVITHMQFSLYWSSRLRALAKVLRARGGELTALDVGSDESRLPGGDASGLAADGYTYERLFPDRRIADLLPRAVAKALWEAFERLCPDAILAGAIAFPTGATAVRWCRRRHRAAIIMDDVRLQDVPRPRLVNWVKRRVYRNVDAVVTAARSHSGTYKAWGMDDERIFFGITVVDNEWFSTCCDKVRSERQKYAETAKISAPYFLGVGRLIAAKNWGALLTAYACYRLRDAGKPWGLVLVGDGPEREALEQEVERLGLEGVRLLPARSQEELCRVYAEAGCLILPSFSETWGLVVNEAMACSLPVLVSNRCGCVESLIQQGVNGWTFDPHDLDELAGLMFRVAAMTAEERANLGGRGREIVADWSPERFAQGAWAAIQYCKDARRGFASPLDRAILWLWKGRYRLT